LQGIESFTIIWDLVAMITALALPLALASVSPAGDPLVLHGECIYPPAIAEKLQGTNQVICDTVEVSAGGVDFRQGEWDAHSLFLGSWNGDVLTVTAIQPRKMRRAKASGQCRIDHANGRISLISCTAFGDGRGWVANFRNVPP
jgi:hypothetical protein